MNTGESENEWLRRTCPDFVAGHETTSTSTSWAIHVLTHRRDIQNKLRQESSTFDTDFPTMDELNYLPYLDAFVRSEVLRFYAPVTWSAYGAARGQTIQLSILAMNRDKKLWGDDAEEFEAIISVDLDYRVDPSVGRRKPNRHTEFLEYGVTFLHSSEVLEFVPDGDSPSLSKYKFSNPIPFTNEKEINLYFYFGDNRMNALLFTLVRAFEFDLAVPKEDILFKRSNAPSGLARGEIPPRASYACRPDTGEEG
ncbi:cytochrome P450 [Dendrothele bispora CBS 962.96]|uniref:Cytochrome P450 n=1 Tax=Dendrothele bispora (strain CBS 962.96) TaxID=1314807 RepID=A0A4S8MV50_DENBC|nr:cytochrome P450 [Dendrothele bispora CBS 962.96]